jgi:hypothetical protein
VVAGISGEPFLDDCASITVSVAGKAVTQVTLGDDQAVWAAYVLAEASRNGSTSVSSASG